MTSSKHPKILIAYASKYGATKKSAEGIAACLPGGADLLPIARGTTADISAYDTIVIGTSIYMGKPLKVLTPFCKRHEDALLSKRVALYMCCIQDQDKSVQDQFAIAFPLKLRAHAIAMALMGGEVDPSRLKFLDAQIMKLVMSEQPKELREKPLSTLQPERYARFAEILMGEP